MPHFPLHVSDPCTLTETRLWYAVGRILRCRNLETNKDDFVHEFHANIDHLEANGSCDPVVAFETPSGLTLRTRTGEVIGTNIGEWTLMSNSLVCSCADRPAFTLDLRYMPLVKHGWWPLGVVTDTGITCESRTPSRLKWLLTDAAAKQLCSHA